MQVRFLLGPAGSGKTFRCLAEIRTALCAAPDGPPLILLAPKQATFQLERQLLGWDEPPREPRPPNGTDTPLSSTQRLAGYTRLHIFSFERLAEFILNQLRIAPPALLSEEGRVMVLRSLLLQKQGELQIFRATARLTGFAQQLSLLLREFQRHRLSAARLVELAGPPDNPAPLRAKLQDLALMLRAYENWLPAHELQDANHLLDVATAALRPARTGIRFAGLWLDGFAEMTPQELDLLAALLPFCEQATLAFCLEREPASDPSWLSPWSVVAQTFRRCHARLANTNGTNVSIETLSNGDHAGRFARCDALHRLERNWSRPAGLTSAPSVSFANPGDHASETAAAGAERTQTAELVGPEMPRPIRLITCANPEAEAVLAAREIRRHVRRGGRWRDCAVIVRRLDAYHATIARVLRRYEIPFFMDQREAVAHHPLTELTRFGFRTVAFGWQHDDWFGALKSGLVYPQEMTIDELENEALARGWAGKVWREPLPIDEENDRGSRLEELRRQAVPPFVNLAAALAQNSFRPNGAQVANALRELWRELNVADTLACWSQTTPSAAVLRPNAPTPVHLTVLEQMHDWLDNLERAFRAEALSLRDWLPILEAGLASLSVGVVPPALDQVLVGAVDRSRNPELKLALVLGLNEGVFPAPPSPAPLLSETDRTDLEQQGVYLGPTRYQRLGHERYLGYIACTRAREQLVLTCAAQNANGQPLNPSPLLHHVAHLTGVATEMFSGTDDWWKSEHCCELEAPALRLASAALDDFTPLVPVLTKWRQVQLAAAPGPLPAEVMEKIFGRELKSSVSGLEDFAACPFKFFAARGLRLQERKEFQFDDRDKGSFQHDALEEFHRQVMAAGRQWRELTPTEAGDWISRIGQELLPRFGQGKFLAGGAARFAGEFLIARLRRLLTVLIEWMPQYGFDPAVSEIAFDEAPAELPVWRLALGEGHALQLRGRIDRVDLYRLDDNTALAVVMDYKSRVRKLDPTKLEHGLELQLLAYLGVLKQLPPAGRLFGINRLVPVGVFYIPLNGGAGKPDGTRAAVLAAGQQSARTAYQHSGRFRADALPHFDSRGAPTGDQFKFAKIKSGEFAKRGNEALPAAEFEALGDKIADHLRDYGRRIFAGEVAVAPFRIGSTTACDYCDFRPVCRFDPWIQPFRDLKLPNRAARTTTPKAGPKQAQ